MRRDLGGDPARRADPRAGRAGPRRGLADGEVLGRPARRRPLRRRAIACWSRSRSSSAPWQACHHAALVVQILFATRTLGLSEQAIGLSYTAMGAGTILASVFGNRISRRVGPGPSLVLGIAICGAGWLLLSVAPTNAWGVAAFTATLMMFSTGAVPDLHQLPGAAPGGDACAPARPDDEHDALADPDSRPARGAARRLARRAFGPAHVARGRRRRRLLLAGRGDAARRDPQPEEPARARSASPNGSGAEADVRPQPAAT
jgi:hypothetical protein